MCPRVVLPSRWKWVGWSWALQCEARGHPGVKGPKEAGASLLCREAERAGAAQPGEETARGDLIRLHPEPQGGCQGDGAGLCPVLPSTRPRGHGHTREHGRVLLNTRKPFSL